MEAMKRVTQESLVDPIFGTLSLNHVQICPQNCIGILNADAAIKIRSAFPETRFRLHANVRVDGKHKPTADLSSFGQFKSYFKALAEVSIALNAGAYTVHAGVRKASQWSLLLKNLDRLEDWFGVPVGIEGHYPTDRNAYWIESWSEYRDVLESGKNYALDLSHLNIVAKQSGVYDHVLTQEMLASEQCIEVHVSHNNGKNDQHIPMDINCPPWWIDDLSYAHPDAVVFYEGNMRKSKTKDA